MTKRNYFMTEKTAWNFANDLPKKVCKITDYGKDESKTEEPYFIEYEIIKPEWRGKQ